jgi:Protein of unknown function (DUF3014)
MNRMSLAAIAATVLTVAGLGGLYWWQQRGRSPTLVTTAPAAEAQPASAPAAASAASEPAIRHPVDESPAAQGPAPGAAADAGPLQWPAALSDLLGRSAVTRFVQSDDFAHRLVATVDNLARPHAAPRLWPVHPTPGRFSVSGQGELRGIAPENAGRYAPLVSMIVAADARRAAELYVRMYPQLQRAYEELGYPGRYFNDRVIEVIDHLLATPEPASGAPLMQLTEIKGSVPSTQPWLRYEFADPALQSLSSGQRILLRVGPTHRQALKAKLIELRRLLARAPTTR